MTKINIVLMQRRRLEEGFMAIYDRFGNEEARSHLHHMRKTCSHLLLRPKQEHRACRTITSSSQPRLLSLMGEEQHRVVSLSFSFVFAALPEADLIGSEVSG